MENLLRQQENNCKLTAITAMESFSRRNCCQKEGGSPHAATSVNSFRCQWDNMGMLLCNLVFHVRVVWVRGGEVHCEVLSLHSARNLVCGLITNQNKLNKVQF